MIKIHVGHYGKEMMMEFPTVKAAIHWYARSIPSGEYAQKGIYRGAGRCIVSARDVEMAANAYYCAHDIREMVSREVQADAMRKWTAFCHRVGF